VKELQARRSWRATCAPPPRWCWPAWSPKHDRIDRVYHIDRGYEKIEQKLIAVGADIERVKESRAVA
jgi:hypothetical protein